MKPYVVDLFCGLGGWSKGFLNEGYDAYGFDIERHQYGGKRYPGQLILQDARTLHGRQIASCAAIVASPPCQEFSYMAMPWSRAKQIAGALRGQCPFPDDYPGSRTLADLTELFNTPFRLQREASEAAGRIIPLVVENVKGAQPWVGRAKGHYGSYYLWGDIESVGGRLVRSGVPKFGESIRPAKRAQKFNPGGTAHPQGSWFAVADSKERGAHQKNDGGSWFGIAHNTESGTGQNPVTGEKTSGHVNQRNGHDHTRHLTNQRESDAVKVSGISFSGDHAPGFNVTAAQRYRDGIKHGGDCFNDPDWPGKQGGVKQRGSGPEWSDTGIATQSSKSDSRKAASAIIAEIPFDLAQWIARILKP